MILNNFLLYSYFFEIHKFCKAVFIRFLHENNEIERWVPSKVLDLIYDVIRTEMFEET